MGAPVTIVEKSPQAMRRLYLGSPQRRRLCGVRRSDGVNERRRLLKKRKRRRERYAVRDDVSKDYKKKYLRFCRMVLNSPSCKKLVAPRSRHERTCKRTAAASVTFGAKEEQWRKCALIFVKKSEQAMCADYIWGPRKDAGFAG